MLVFHTLFHNDDSKCNLAQSCNLLCTVHKCVFLKSTASWSALHHSSLIAALVAALSHPLYVQQKCFCFHSRAVPRCVIFQSVQLL